jgi:predicted helicase
MPFEKPQREKEKLTEEADGLERLFNELDYKLRQFHLAKAMDSMSSESDMKDFDEDKAKLEKEKESVRKQLVEIYRKISGM